MGQQAVRMSWPGPGERWPPSVSGIASPCPHSPFPRGPSSSTQNLNGHDRALAPLGFLSCSQLVCLQPRQPLQHCPPKGSAHWAHLGVLPAHPTSQLEPLPGTASIGRMGCSAAWLAPLHPGPSARRLKSLPPDPTQEPLTLKSMKVSDSSVNAPAARSLRSRLMTLEKKELDQHGELTRVSRDCSPQRGCFPFTTSASHIMSCPLFQRCLV